MTMNRYFTRFLLLLTSLTLVYFSACSNSTNPPEPGNGNSPAGTSGEAADELQARLILAEGGQEQGAAL